MVFLLVQTQGPNISLVLPSSLPENSLPIPFPKASGILHTCDSSSGSLLRQLESNKTGVGDSLGSPAEEALTFDNRPLNNMDLNGIGPLACGFFFWNTV